MLLIWLCCLSRRQSRFLLRVSLPLAFYQVFVNRSFDIKVHTGNHKCDTSHSCLNISSILIRKLGYEYCIYMFIIYYNGRTFLTLAGC